MNYTDEREIVMNDPLCAERCTLCGSDYRVVCLPPEESTHGHICAGCLWIENMMTRLSGRMDQPYQPHGSAIPTLLGPGTS
jgi:hypothetical protein